MVNTKNTDSMIKKIIAVLAVPVAYFLGFILNKTPGLAGDGATLTIINILISYALFFTIILLYKNMLKEQWRKFKKLKMKSFIKIALIILGSVFTHVLLKVTRSVMATLEITGTASMTDTFVEIPAIITLIALTIPLTAPFVEEVVFRHILFYDIKNSLLKWIMLPVSAILFGLIHFNNFGGNLVQLIPYMVIGVYFSLIYQFTKNIWSSILVHVLFNGMTVFLAFLGTILTMFI